MNKNIKLTESEVAKIVSDATKKILSESFFHRTYREGKPQKISDVFLGNGWKPVTVAKDANSITVRVYKHVDSFLYDEPLPFEELADDLNVYFEDKKSPCRATGWEDENGSFVKITKN
jgi:hypothetical protein